MKELKTYTTMKRLLGFMLSLVMPLMVWSADGDTFTSTFKDSKNVEYNLTFKVISETKKTCQVGSGEYIKPKNNNFTKYEGALSIPESINGYTVSQIADYAFYSCSKITSFSITGNCKIERIGSSAFFDCNTLSSIELNEGLLEIGVAAFMNCYNLQTITIPESTLEIKKRAFSGCI